MSNKILITGCAGFIGFSLAYKLLNSNKNFQVYGIDNLNEYYDTSLKKDRLKNLNNFKNFTFSLIALDNFQNLKEFFKTNKFDYIIHLAAQAGVRYSFENPDSYIESNIIATYNLLEIIKNLELSHFIFASTSSTYGFSDKKNSFSENNVTDKTISLYSSTKKSCEVLIHNYSYNFYLPSTVLRFFTVYGPWGRPDMALFKFVKSIFNDEPIDVYNNGELWRDFTFIDDLTESIFRLIEVIPGKEKVCNIDTLSLNAPYRIVNIGNQNAIKITDFISILEKVMSKKIKIQFKPMQKGDVKFTLSDSSLLEKLIGYTPSTNIEYGIKKFYDWYLNYYQDNKK